MFLPPLRLVRQLDKTPVNWKRCSHEGDRAQDQLPEWQSLPAAGHFKLEKHGCGGSRARASSLEKARQCSEYSKYLRWAWESCGVTETVFVDMLKRSRSLGKLGRRKQQGDIPRFLCQRSAYERPDERAYAVLLCRAAGLRRAAEQHLDDLWGRCIRAACGRGAPAFT
jgi:hypothetical protein